jgi:hypothetical protein
MPRMRRTAIVLLFVTLSLSAAAPKKKATSSTIAPAEVPHAIAQFLRGLSKDGARSVTFKASATGTHFFFEDAGGVTVYQFAGGHYTKAAFLPGAKLSAAMKKYAG